VASLFLFSGSHHQPFVRLGLNQRARISLRFSVERDERDGEGDAWQEEEVTPADAGPEPVEGVDDLVADGDDGRVVAPAEWLAASDVVLRHVDDAFDVDVDEADGLVDILLGLSPMSFNFLFCVTGVPNSDHCVWSRVAAGNPH
jgi:hypothetical protein